MRGKGVVVFVTVLAVLQVGPSSAQLPDFITNEIFGPNSLVRGVKNIMGGILAADNVHKKCLQKTICSEFSDEVVEVKERIDPVKRTIVR